MPRRKPSAPTASARSSRCTTPTADCRRATRSARARATCGAIASGSRSKEARSTRSTWGGRRSSRRRHSRGARRRPQLAQDRRGLVPVALVQGPRGHRRDQCRRGLRPRDDRLRVDRQPRERRRRGRRARGQAGLDLRPPRPRTGQARRHLDLRPSTRPRARHLRRREPPVRAGRRPLRLGYRQRQPARLLRRRLARRWPSRSPSSSGWRLPTAVVTPMAGGSLVTKLRKGFTRVRATPASSTGQLPRASTAPRPRGAPQSSVSSRAATTCSCRKYRTPSRAHIAIGNPADGRYAQPRSFATAAARRQSVSDAELVAGIRLLAETSGVFTETAGGVTVAATPRARRRRAASAPDDEVVICLTGHGLKTVEAVQDTVLDAPVIAAEGERSRRAPVNQRRLGSTSPPPSPVSRPKTCPPSISPPSSPLTSAAHAPSRPMETPSTKPSTASSTGIRSSPPVCATSRGPLPLRHVLSYR